MVDTLDTARICRWKEHDMLIVDSNNDSADSTGNNERRPLDNIIKCQKQDSILVGQFTTGDFFSFDCKTGKSKFYKTQSEFAEACKELGFGEDVKLLTIGEYYSEYWSKH